MDPKTLQEQFEKALADMRKANDDRLAEIEKKTRADPLLVEKVDKANAEVGRLEKELKAAIREFETKGARPGATAAGEDDQAKEAYRKAFDRFLRKNETEDMAELAKAVSIGSDPDGGYAVPTTLDTEIEKYERDNTPMRRLCRVVPMSNENFEKLVQQGGASSGWVDELEARPETGTPTFAALKPFFGEVYSNPGVSQKALDDMIFNVEAWLGEEVGIEFAEQENDAFTRGTGVKKPKGILAYTLATTADGVRPFNQIQKIHSGAAGTFDGDDLIDVIHALKRGYRQGATWMTSNLGVAAVRKLKMNNEYVWAPGLTAGAPDTLLGYPVEENDDMPEPAADANAFVFGNFRRAYWIIDVHGARVIRDNLTNKPKIHFYTTKRVGGFLVNDRALKVLTLSV